MSTTKFKMPPDVTHLSVEQQQFKPETDGTFTAPSHFRKALEAMGCRSLGETGETLPVQDAQRVQQVIPERQPPSEELSTGNLPPEVEVGLPATVPAKMIAAAAAQRARLASPAWNALPPDELNSRLGAEIDVHKKINAKLKELEAAKPEDVRKWLQEQGANVNGVKNADLLLLAAKTMNENEKA